MKYFITLTSNLVKSMRLTEKRVMLCNQPIAGGALREVSVPEKPQYGLENKGMV